MKASVAVLIALASVLIAHLATAQEPQPLPLPADGRGNDGSMSSHYVRAQHTEAAARAPGSYGDASPSSAGTTLSDIGTGTSRQS